MNRVVGKLVFAFGLSVFVLLASPRGAAACDAYYGYPHEMTKRKGTWTIKIGYHDRYHFFSGSQYQLCSVYVFTKSKRIATFIHNHSITNAFWKTILASIKHYTCRDMLSGKRILRVERSVARAIAKHYRKKTRRRSGRLDVMIDIHLPDYPYCLPKSLFGILGG